MTATFTEELYLLKNPLVVAIDRPWEEITSDERMLLGKILASVRESLASVKIVCAPGLATAALPVGSRVVAFGVALTPPVAGYELSVSAGVHCIQADALSALDDTRKKNLWAAMKKLI